jgi:twitching motility protein PilT
MRRVLRQDPDVILIGEMRDEETVRTALSAAETGHLVLSTVHTLDAAESVNRIIDFFQPHEQDQARAMLAGTLKGVVSQRLVPTIDGQGRVAVCEILRMTGRARDMIMDPEQTGRLPEVISEGAYYGMQTFDQALLGFYQAGRISMEDALRTASSPHDFKLLVAAEGRTATSMDDLGDAAGEPIAPVAPATEMDDDELGAVPAVSAVAMDAAPTPPGGGRSTPPPVAV